LDDDSGRESGSRKDWVAVSERSFIRPATLDDADECGQVIFDAFGAVNARHGFATRWPSVEFATEFVRGYLSLEGIYGVVCELEGTVIGCNFLDQRGTVAGVGPTAVRPSTQGTGVGRRLVIDVLRRAGSARGVRLLQDAFNTGSLALYVSLGFEVKEPIVLMRGLPSAASGVAVKVRPIDLTDLDSCCALCRDVHGFDRRRELSDAVRVEPGSAILTVRDQRVVAYASGFGTFHHAVAASDDDMRALISAATGVRHAELEFLLPARNGPLVGWCTEQGMTVVKQMTLMAIGAYSEPQGSWIPSVLY
jgi:GNAT superfamily N-acetyltransferase